MMVFIRPTGCPVGQTLGFGPNGSSASLDTAPAFTSIEANDQVLIERAGALALLPVALFAGGPLGPPLTTLLQSLPTVLPATSGQLWLDGGVLALS
jgi:hypothetical protein